MMQWFRKSPGTDPSRELYVATVLAAARLLAQRRSSPRGDESFLERECRRAQEVGHPLTLLKLELANWSAVVTAIGQERATRTLEELKRTLSGTLRATDILRHEGTEADNFLIFLPGTPSTDLGAVTRNLRQAVHGYRILAPDTTASRLRLHPWIASASLLNDGFTSVELMAVLESRLAEERTKPIPPLPEEDDQRPLLRLVA